jgi:hypothetical protein
MFMRDNQDELDQYLFTRRTNNLVNWVNIWQPAIKASLQSAQALTVDTMGRVDDHFEHLTPTAKRPPRAQLPPRFRTRHDCNRSSRQQLWKAPAFVRPISKYFAQIINKKTKRLPQGHCCRPHNLPSPLN